VLARSVSLLAIYCIGLCTISARRGYDVFVLVRTVMIAMNELCCCVLLGAVLYHKCSHCSLLKIDVCFIFSLYAHPVMAHHVASMVPGQDKLG